MNGSVSTGGEEEVESNRHLLYHQLLVPSQQILFAVEGSFTTPNAHDMLIIRHRAMELWTLHSDVGRMECIHSVALMVDVYAAAAVTTSSAVRTVSSSKSKPGFRDGVMRSGIDYVALTSESGYLTLLRYELSEPPLPASLTPERTFDDPSAVEVDESSKQTNTTVIASSLRGSFIKVSEVLLGRSGARLTVPGMRMVVDERGSAILVTALMRCKVVVPLTQTGAHPSELQGAPSGEGASDDEEGTDEDVDDSVIVRKKCRRERERGVITLGSPIEVHRQSVIYSICAIEGSSESALFAALEEDITDVSEATSSTSPRERRKTLVVYAYIASLHQVQRTHLVYPPMTSHKLISIPASPSAPGGVLVCTDEEVIWYDLSATGDGGAGGNTGVFKCSAPLPRRADYPDTLYDPSIISHALTSVPSGYFLLLQDEHGDMFQVSIASGGVQAAKSAFRLHKGLDGGPQQLPTVRNPLSVHYFESTSPCRALALFRNGFLFAASDDGAQHCLFRVREGYSSEKEYVIRRIKTTRNALQVKPTDPQAAVLKAPLDGSHKFPSSFLPHGLPPPSSRTICTFLPHTKVKHLDVIQLFPSTPAITSLVTRIPGQSEEEEPGEATQQQQIQITYTGGRGPGSVVLQARYGFASKVIKHEMLPMQFFDLIPLSSVQAITEFMQVQLQVMEAAGGSSGSRRGTHSGRRTLTGSALRRISRVASQYAIGTDRIVLSTVKGTMVFTVGERVLQDTASGFHTSERTICASTLRYGRGYFQVTPRALYVVAAPPIPSSSFLGSPVEATTWVHPHGKVIVCAASSATCTVLSFAGGGLSSFHFGSSGSKLKQWSAHPTFPACTAVALLQPPSSALTDSIHNELRSVLFQKQSVIAADNVELMAIASSAKEVQIMDPQDLHSSKLVIQLRLSPANRTVTSLLLTYMNEASDSSVGWSHANKRRAFCFVGFSDGSLVRCEIDAQTFTVLEQQELSCGSQSCQLISGDGETVCYVKCGEQCWRCCIRAGVPKIMPYRFPVTHTAFARFSTPRRPAMPFAGTASEVEDDEDVEGSAIRLGGAAPSNEERIVALRGNELFLFSTQQTASSTLSSLEYSLVPYPLPLEGRRMLRHPTRPQYLIVASTEHRGYSKNALEANAKSEKPSLLSAGPKRSLNTTHQYNSSIQLFHDRFNAVLPPYYMQEGEAILSLTMGSFFVEIGKEPVIVVGVAQKFFHGENCGGKPRWTNGVLRCYRCVPALESRQLDPEGRPFLRFEPIHSTHVLYDPTASQSSSELHSDYPSALHICDDVGLLFVGLGKECGLRIYSYGKQQLLFKRQMRNTPSRINQIEVVFCHPTGGTSQSTHVGSRELYQCPPDQPDVLRRVRSQQMLIVCATNTDSIFVATLQPGTKNTPSFLMIIARDAVPRYVSCMTVIDERTIAVADRFGTAAFLHIPATTRTSLAESVDALSEMELGSIQTHCLQHQHLEEVAVHHTGQLITSLHTQPFDPSRGSDPTLATKIVLYGTALGTVGCYCPFVSEEDGAFASYLRPLLRERMRLLLYPGDGSLPYHMNQNRGKGHHVVEGEWLEAYRQSSVGVFPPSSKVILEQKLNRTRNVEEARRVRLQLPPRELPTLEDFIARQRALVTLPL